MKKWIPILALAVLAATLIIPLADESDADPDSERMYGVTFIAGTNTLGTIYVHEGELISNVPEVPASYDYWDFDFTQPITEDVFVYAKSNETDVAIIFWCALMLLIIPMMVLVVRGRL